MLKGKAPGHNDMLPPYRTMKNKSPILGVVHHKRLVRLLVIIVAKGVYLLFLGKLK